MKYFVDIAALALLYTFVFFKRWKRRGPAPLLANTLLYVYLSFVLYFTLMPVIVSIPFIFDHPYRSMNLVPFVDVSLGRGDFLRQVVLNILMTVPFGYLYPLARNGDAKFRHTVFSCLLLSLGIELLQPWFYRSSDITDVIDNVIGSAAGYCLYLLFRPLTDRIWRRLSDRR